MDRVIVGYSATVIALNHVSLFVAVEGKFSRSFWCTCVSLNAFCECDWVIALNHVSLFVAVEGKFSRLFWHMALNSLEFNFLIFFHPYCFMAEIFVFGIFR